MPTETLAQTVERVLPHIDRTGKGDVVYHQLNDALAALRPPAPYRLALRPEPDQPDKDWMDDVVIRDVSMFRAEVMDRKSLWMCCYLDGTGVDLDRIDFLVHVKKGKLQFRVTEYPKGNVAYE